MAPRIVFANLPFGPNAASLFDQAFSDVAALSIIPVTATGTNLLILNPIASTFPFNLTSYGSFYGLYTFTAVSTSTANVTANINGLGALNVYLSDGITQAGANALTAGGFYAISYNAALNNNTGGFYLISTGAGTTTFTLTGDVNATGTSPLATTISANAVTYDKFQQSSQGSVLLANPTGGAGNYQEVTTGPTLNFAGTTLQTAALTGDVTTGANSFATTIANSAVTLAKMGDLPANTVIGNNTGAAVPPLALSRVQLTAMVNAFTSALSGTVPASGGGTVNFLRADGLWVPNAGGLVLLKTLSADTTPQPDLSDTTVFTTAFNDYYFTFENIVPTVNSHDFWMEVTNDSGVTWKTAGYIGRTSHVNSGGVGTDASTANITLLINCASTAGGGLSGSGTWYNVNSTTVKKMYMGSVSALNAGGDLALWDAAGFWNGDNLAMNGVRFRFSPPLDVNLNSIASGKIRIYGILST